MTVAVVLFTSDLRLHDHPPLSAALRAADEVVPLFVRDPGVQAAGFDVPNRRAFLADCLTDLDGRLRRRGGRLVVRTGPVAREVCAVVAECRATQVHMSADVTSYAHRRERVLREELSAQGVALHVHDAVTTAVAPGSVTPSGTDHDHYAVFTPYFRSWSQVSLRQPLPAPRTVRVPDTARGEAPPSAADVAGASPGLAKGGETAGRTRCAQWWSEGGLSRYEEQHDDLAGDASSRLSPYLHFGALSPVELVGRARAHGGAGAEAFVRQVCWRDFHHQVLAARPDAAVADYRTRHDRWRGEEETEDISAWREGRTGYPVVDAGMRQLRHEGWMHNRARLLVASFLTKTLYVDWRIGARHFLDLLVDGDVANNQLNWQWVAGTGTDTRPHRVLNPVTQGRRFDPRGTYVRRWVAELASVEDRAVHEPWHLPDDTRAALGYPEPLIDLADGLARFRHARGRD